MFRAEGEAFSFVGVIMEAGIEDILGGESGKLNTIGKGGRG